MNTKQVLFQFTTVNGTEYQSTSEDNDIFMLLSTAQHFAAKQIPTLGPNWLQAHPQLQFHIGCLFHAGRTTIFSLAERYEVKIVWAWRNVVDTQIQVVDGPPDEGWNQPTLESPSGAGDLVADVFNGHCPNCGVDVIKEVKCNCDGATPENEVFKNTTDALPPEWDESGFERI